MKELKAASSRRWCVQMWGADGRGFVELCASSSEGGANALAFLWASHDHRANVQVVDLRSGNVTMSCGAVRSCVNQQDVEYAS